MCRGILASRFLGGSALVGTNGNNPMLPQQFDNRLLAAMDAFQTERHQTSMARSRFGGLRKLHRDVPLVTWIFTAAAHNAEPLAWTKSTGRWESLLQQAAQATMERFMSFVETLVAFLTNQANIPPAIGLAIVFWLLRNAVQRERESFKALGGALVFFSFVGFVFGTNLWRWGAPGRWFVIVCVYGNVVAAVSSTVCTVAAPRLRDVWCVSVPHGGRSGRSLVLPPYLKAREDRAHNEFWQKSDAYFAKKSVRLKRNNGPAPTRGKTWDTASMRTPGQQRNAAAVD